MEGGQAMSNVSYMTEEGLAKLKKELDQLVKVERPSISEQIAEARDKGDLSENAEYDAAKEAQGLLEMKISKVKEMLANARVIDESMIDTDTVQIMNRVKLRNCKTEKLVEYKIVSESESDFKTGKIAVTTPIAKGLLGKKVGEFAEISVPSGQMSFEIMDISV
ncbi:MAG: transcription elongation factor GreA [Bacteroidales bacterium]|jgi:transcription elongation factor GreA|nr:transcription elongation factor GreA [Bacteroidales bacterium]